MKTKVFLGLMFLIFSMYLYVFDPFKRIVSEESAD